MEKEVTARADIKVRKRKNKVGQSARTNVNSKCLEGEIVMVIQARLR